MYTHYQQGFTLVELLTVIAILGVLAMAVVVTLNPMAQIGKSLDAQRKSDLSQIQKGLEIYYQDNGKYPPQATGCAYQIQGNNGDGNDCISWGEAWSPYMTKLPKDTVATKHYVYIADPSQQSYWLYANLDRGGKDTQACNNGNACPNVPAGVDCGGAAVPCNYGVSSVNVTP